jgi:hypothetical protein
MTTKQTVKTTSKAAVKSVVGKASNSTVKKASTKSAEKSALKRFRVPLEGKEGSEVCGFSVPFDVEKTFGTRGRVPVRGTLNGFPFRTSLFPMGGCHMMVVNRHLRAGAGVKGGDTASVLMTRDTEPRVITPPGDFSRALKANREAQTTWDKLSYTHRREHVEHIEEAKRPETRERRIERSILLLADGKREPRG